MKTGDKIQTDAVQVDDGFVLTRTLSTNQHKCFAFGDVGTG